MVAVARKLSGPCSEKICQWLSGIISLKCLSIKTHTRRYSPRPIRSGPPIKVLNLPPDLQSQQQQQQLLTSHPLREPVALDRKLQHCQPEVAAEGVVNAVEVEEVVEVTPSHAPLQQPQPNQQLLLHTKVQGILQRKERTKTCANCISVGESMQIIVQHRGSVQ